MAIERSILRIQVKKPQNRHNIILLFFIFSGFNLILKLGF